ncbi:hypothetical protein [Nostoc sp. ChiSLP03a]|uniref:hypothetical protein n=1 Tax=Nostoc sp. ChiSLP03a TaxID=3075380 RepID=UPI002AD3B397|nr:hypothetical protein [Nostoc sp. ChiSLP03a]MDZ8213465.1 hypothetical protein [Nostoc sp. ChiSLP03a]
MKIETEQLLATLELLCSSSFVWETPNQGEFNLWNLMISEGFVNLTDIKLAFKHWQNIEEWGTPTNQEASDYEYAPLRYERKDKTWNESIASERQRYYQKIQQLLTQNFSNLQAYNLSIPKAKYQDFTWEHPDFSVSIVVAETSNNHWLCLAPIVPDQVSDDVYAPHQLTTQIVCEESINAVNESLIAEFKSCLDDLTPITIYGYHYGGYNCTYQHHLVGAYAKTKTTAIELALQAATMVIILEKPNVHYAGDAYDSLKLSEFMNQCLRHRTLYNISFWDVRYTYQGGQTPAGDWIGVHSRSEFEYNP